MTPRNSPRAPGPRVPVYVISVAAELTGLHPQTLRTYDRIGLVSPGRAGGGGRRYSLHDLAQQLDVVQGVAPATTSGAARGDQADPVVGAQRLRVQAGQLGGDADHVDRHPRAAPEVVAGATPCTTSNCCARSPSSRRPGSASRA